MPGMTEWERRQYERAGLGTPGAELFKFKEEEYTDQPFALRLDAARGVLYLDNSTTGELMLRICRIPEEVTQRMPHYYATLDLRTAIPYTARAAKAKLWEKSPVFLSVQTDSFIVETESGEIILEVLGVPKQAIRTLENKEFTDITTGYTGGVAQ